jgi:hypothetical protein
MGGIGSRYPSWEDLKLNYEFEYLSASEKSDY